MSCSFPTHDKNNLFDLMMRNVLCYIDNNNVTIYIYIYIYLFKGTRPLSKAFFCTVQTVQIYLSNPVRKKQFVEV